MRWPEAVGAGLSLVWEGRGTAGGVVEAAAERYFELTGVLAAAKILGVGPQVYRRRSRGEATLAGRAEVRVEIVALRRRCAQMIVDWRLTDLGKRSPRADVPRPTGGAELVWCWRDLSGRSAVIPEVARIGILALDGARIRGAKATP